MATFPDYPAEQLRGFFDAIHDDPGDVTARLVFADWLEEHGDPRAELLRLQAEYVQAGGDRGLRESVQNRSWLWGDRYAEGWLGPLREPLASAFHPEEAKLVVHGFEALHLLSDGRRQGLHQALRQGWIVSLELKGWDDRCVKKAGAMGLFAGPSSLRFTGSELGDEGLKGLAGCARLRTLFVCGLHRTITDPSLTHLAGLTAIRELVLWSWRNLTGNGLKQLSRLSELRDFSLYDSPQLTDNALADISHFGNLERLSLSGCQSLTGTGLASLARLSRLRYLNMRECSGLTGAGLAALRGLVALQGLDLSWCRRLPDEALAHLAALPGLRQLNLSYCSALTDAHLAHLAKLQRLEELYLCTCPGITGAGVAHLHGLKNLKVLNLVGCKLQPHETRALRKALPGCDVRRQW